MSESEFAKRAKDTPDQYTLAWWNKQFSEVLTGYRGASHAINRSIAECESLVASIAALRAKIAALERERDEDRAKIGELNARIVRIAEFLNASKAKNGASDAGK